LIIFFLSFSRSVGFSRIAAVWETSIVDISVDLSTPSRSRWALSFLARISFTDYTVQSDLGTPAVHGFVWSHGKMFDIGSFVG
jgi:hypothetical protein